MSSSQGRPGWVKNDFVKIQIRNCGDGINYKKRYDNLSDLNSALLNSRDRIVGPEDIEDAVPPGMTIEYYRIQGSCTCEKVGCGPKEKGIAVYAHGYRQMTPAEKDFAMGQEKREAEKALDQAARRKEAARNHIASAIKLDPTLAEQLQNIT